MKPLLTLIRWHLRQLMLLNIAMMLAAAIYTMLWSERFDLPRSGILILGGMVHSVLMVTILGRSSPRGPGFLYAQSFSRDQLWWSTWLATVISGTMVSAVMFLVVISGLRSWAQFHLGNPWFPLIGPSEFDTSLWLLSLYVIELGPLHYVWVRCRQPFGDASAGWFLLVGFYLFVINAIDKSVYVVSTSTWLLHSINLLMSVVMTIACWRFHRSAEVQA